jgi:thioredoxin reductase (NADPH)
MASLLTLFGANWCPDCRNTKMYLGQIGVAYDWVDIDENPEANQRIADLNNGKRVIPTIVLSSGEVMVNPSNAEIAAQLGIKTTITKPFYDLSVVGSGPAGLTAALYAAREGLDVLVIERGAVGGQTSVTDRLDNFPGFPDGISGAEFSDRLKRQAERFGVELLLATEVDSLTADKAGVDIKTASDQSVRSRAALITTGSTYRRLNVPGEEDFLGAGIHFCATCDGPFYKGKRVAVIGGGNSAGEESLFLTRFTNSVEVLVRGAEMTASQVVVEKMMEHPSISINLNTKVERFEGNGSLSKVIVNRDGNQDSVDVDGVFVFIGLKPNTGWLPDTLELDDYGFVVTKQNLETNLPGVFAAGDVRRGSTKQAASAAGEGATAALMMREYLRTVG